jgi:catecholate siderophore receptor
MRTIETLRPVLSSVAASASLATGLLFIAADEAEAQDAAQTPPASDQPVQRGTSPTSPQTVAQAQQQSLPPVTVIAPHSRNRPAAANSGPERRVAARRRPSREKPPAAAATTSTDNGGAGGPTANTLQIGTGLDRLPGPIQSIPQTITVIPQVVIQQQQATTVNQVLQYVPGITVSTGEGNGGITGDQFRIRGFDASGDLYVDGLRDFGSYVRDSFATQDILVLKGPSSQSFGNGTTGGVIEMESKKAHLGNANSIEVTGGMGPYGRTVLDVNRQIDATTAVRIVAMGNGQDIVDRDHVYSDRWGVLGSVGLGLGTDQTLTMNYFHQHSQARPDFGVPMGKFGGSSVGEPLTEYGVPRSNYFGRESDRDLMDADVATILYKGQFGDWLTLSNSSRFGYYTRDVKFTPSLCMDVAFPLTAIYGIPSSTCASDVAAGNLNTSYTRWPVGGTKQTSYGGENVTSATMRFNTGFLRHELIAGVDTYAQHSAINFYIPSGAGSAGTLLDPIFQNPPSFSDLLSSTGTTARSWDVGPFISDRIWLTPQFSVLGGVRWDHYNVQALASGTPVETTTELASPKASLIWEPTKQQTYYFSYAQSFTPPANNITSLSSPLSLVGVAGTPNLKPEADTTYEIGGKWSFLNGSLGATAALFRVDKDNTSYTDPTSGIQTTTDDKVRVQGVELGLTGKLTDVWNVQASYAYMDSEIVSSSISIFNPVSANGNRVPYVSQHGASLWTTYDIVPLIQQLSGGRRLPGQLLVGGGINYRSDYYVNDANSLRIPAATTLDAMASYDFDRYHLAVNVTNLTNELAYSAAFGNGYATPIAGRTVTGTFGVKW